MLLRPMDVLRIVRSFEGAGVRCLLTVANGAVVRDDSAAAAAARFALAAGHTVAAAVAAAADAAADEATAAARGAVPRTTAAPAPRFRIPADMEVNT